MKNKKNINHSKKSNYLGHILGYIYLLIGFFYENISSFIMILNFITTNIFIITNIFMLVFTKLFANGLIKETKFYNTEFNGAWYL